MSLAVTLLPQHFEPDPHLALAGSRVENVRIISGEAETDDVTVVSYRNNPCLSFYDVNGRLIDVDHYLPDAYREKDEVSVDTVIYNLPVQDRTTLDKKDRFTEQLGAVLDAGGESLARGLDRVFGLKSEMAVEEAFRRKYDVGTDQPGLILLDRFSTMRKLLRAYVEVQLAAANQYVHFTTRDSIIITPLDKQAGVAVLIETRDDRNRPLRPADWRIIRTSSPAQLQKALVFRTDDIRNFFQDDRPDPVGKTARYVAYRKPGRLEFDSLLDDTNNLLTVPLHNGCYQILATDPEVVVVLSGPRTMSIVNTHGSVIPQKWLQKITFPGEVAWVRTDENLKVAFCMLSDGSFRAFAIDGEKVLALPQVHGVVGEEQSGGGPQLELGKKQEDGGPWAGGFTLDQTGGLTLVRDRPTDQLVRYRTNVNTFEIPGRERSLSGLFNDLSDLFRGEALFEPTVVAKPVAAEQAPPEAALPTAVEAARFDYETNVDHLLAAAGTDYDELLAVREKLAIARTNIADRFTEAARVAGIRLVGRRLRQTINNITLPAERRVDGLIERTRADQLLTQARGFRKDMNRLNDPGAYRDVLNAIRTANEELRRMDPANAGKQYTEFRAIQTELNDLFSRQITEDGHALQAFITKEIEQIEEAIANTNESRRLESLLSTHPAALELLALLKQPFVLQSIAKERTLSPAGIQQRLYGAVEERLEQLRADRERQEAERNAAKLQLGGMIREAIDFFITHHSGSFSDVELRRNAAYAGILTDINKLERTYADPRLAGELRAHLERVILNRNREDLQRAVAFEGKYAFVKNDPDLYVDLESTVRRFPTWELQMIEKAGAGERYLATFVRNTDREVYRPSTTDNLLSGRAFETDGEHVQDYLHHYYTYERADYEPELLDALWKIATGDPRPADFPQFDADLLQDLAPDTEAARRALGAAREKKRRDRLERTRDRNVPVISPEFIDETPYFQEKLREFFIKAKLQLGTGSGVLLLSGPPSTGKSAFLKFAAALMNREYFEHASDKWQTKNSLVTAVRFGESGPYTTPAGFTRAITTAHSIVNIEEIKEWPEALRKSLNPFFAGSKEFVAPDGTRYRIGDNLLLCAAANLGAMYRLDDEAFTADFWSRIDVVEYDYAPLRTDRAYVDRLHRPQTHSLLTMQDLVRQEFTPDNDQPDPDARGRDLARRLLRFLLLPKADDRVKRERLEQEINQYFETAQDTDQVYGPEEAAKVALRRIKDLQQLSSRQFFDLYDHFVNGRPLQDADLAALQTTDLTRHGHLHVVFRTLFHLESCLRHLRELFQRTGGQSEIEGTNREFISSVYLLGLMGRLNA